MKPAPRHLMALTLLACICQQGCFYATHNVMRIGQRYEWHENPSASIVDGDGRIAFACDCTEWREPYGRHRNSRRGYSDRVVITKRQGLVYCLQPHAADEANSSTCFSLPWKAATEPFAKRNPTRADLPEQFGQMEFKPIAPAGTRPPWFSQTALVRSSRRTGPGKCAQLLLPIAFLFDVATGPIQFFVMLSIDPPPL